MILLSLISYICDIYVWYIYVCYIYIPYLIHIYIYILSSLLSLIILIIQRSLWDKICFLYICLRSNIVPSSHKDKSPHLIIEAGSGLFQGRTHWPAFFPPWLSGRVFLPTNVSWSVGEMLPAVRCSCPRWFWKVCCLLCGSCRSVGVLQIGDGNTPEKMHDFDLIQWFWAKTWKLECLSRKLFFNSESYPLSIAGMLACMFWP